MPHVRYSKADLSRLIAHTITCQQRGRLLPGVLTAVFLGIAEALDGHYTRLWKTIEANWADLHVQQNGQIPLDPQA